MLRGVGRMGRNLCEAPRVQANETGGSGELAYSGLWICIVPRRSLFTVAKSFTTEKGKKQKGCCRRRRQRSTVIPTGQWNVIFMVERSIETSRATVYRFFYLWRRLSRSPVCSQFDCYDRVAHVDTTTSGIQLACVFLASPFLAIKCRGKFNLTSFAGIIFQGISTGSHAKTRCAS